MVQCISATMIFDTLHHAKNLQKAGFTEKQAEAQVELFKEQTNAINEFIDNNLATKADIKAEIKNLEMRIEMRIKELELRMLVKLGSLIMGCMSTLIVLMKLFKL